MNRPRGDSSKVDSRGVPLAARWYGSPIPKLAVRGAVNNAHIKVKARNEQPVSRAIEAWEDEGGAVAGPLGRTGVVLSGTAAQVEWAERIKRNVSAEFDRVAASFQSIADRQGGDRRADTEAIIAIVGDKRDEVLEREHAGYFIHDWQDISDQVRQMVFHDARYQTIKGNRLARQRRQ